MRKRSNVEGTSSERGHAAEGPPNSSGRIEVNAATLDEVIVRVARLRIQLEKVSAALSGTAEAVRATGSKAADEALLEAFDHLQNGLDGVDLIGLTLTMVEGGDGCVMSVVRRACDTAGPASKSPGSPERGREADGGG